MVIWELSIWSSSIDDLPRATTKRMIWCHDIASDPKMPYLVSSHHIWDPHSMSTHQWIICVRSYMAVCQNLVPLVNIKIAGKWMFIPLKMVLIGIDPYPYNLYATILSWTIFKLKPPIMWDLVTHSIPTQLWLPIHNAQILGFWCFRTFFWSVKKKHFFFLNHMVFAGSEPHLWWPGCEPHRAPPGARSCTISFSVARCRCRFTMTSWKESWDLGRWHGGLFFFDFLVEFQHQKMLFFVFFPDFWCLGIFWWCKNSRNMRMEPKDEEKAGSRGNHRTGNCPFPRFTGGDDWKMVVFRSKNA